MITYVENQAKRVSSEAQYESANISRIGEYQEKTIGHLERGNYNPSLKLAWDISKVFNATIEDIFDYSEEE